MAESIEVLESYRERALQDLKAAETMLASKFHLVAVSLAYYAVFYAITALLLKEGVVAHKHKQLGIEFRKHFIKTNRLPPRYSELLHELYEARQTADYDAIPNIPEEKVGDILKDAKEFVDVLLALK